MRPGKTVQLLLHKLKGKIHPRGVGLIFCTLGKFHGYCNFLNILPTTHNLVKHFPNIFFADHVYFSDLYLEQCGVTTYSQIGEFVDAAVNIGMYTYGPEDSIEDFNTTRSLIADVRALFPNYSNLIDLKLNDKYTCSSQSRLSDFRN